jgi:hypothetical protein
VRVVAAQVAEVRARGDHEQVDADLVGDPPGGVHPVDAHQRGGGRGCDHVGRLSTVPDRSGRRHPLVPDRSGYGPAGEGARGIPDDHGTADEPEGENVTELARSAGAQHVRHAPTSAGEEAS